MILIAGLLGIAALELELMQAACAAVKFAILSACISFVCARWRQLMLCLTSV